MATIINNPGEHSENESDGVAGGIIGGILVILLLLVGLLFAMPYIRQKMYNQNQPSNPTINVEIKTPTGSSTQY